MLFSEKIFANVGKSLFLCSVKTQKGRKAAAPKEGCLFCARARKEISAAPRGSVETPPKASPFCGLDSVKCRLFNVKTQKKMKRIKTPLSQGRDYEKMLKDYFGKFLYGLEVKQDGGQVQVQLIYFDFKHIETVRRELAQMMPEVMFTKLKRDYTEAAETWALAQLLSADHRNQPVLFVQTGDTLVKTSLNDIARSELNQLELDDGDINYTDDAAIACCCNEENLRENSWD